MSLMVTEKTDQDLGWIKPVLTERWGGTVMISRGHAYDAAQLPGFVAWRDGERVGLATYVIAEATCELMTIDALEKQSGAGTMLLDHVVEAAKGAGCRRLFLITTNDNLDALRFYQRRGLSLCAVRPGAVTEARRQKPSIPLTGAFGIPLRDELELEMVF